MREKKLPLAHNVVAARVFLNLFGLTLEDATTNINKSSIIRITDKKNVVGEMHFKNGQVRIAASYNGSSLEAYFDFPKVSSIAGIDDWASIVKFKATNSDSATLSGEFPIECSMDSNTDFRCNCSPLVMCITPNGEKTTIKVNRECRLLRVEISSSDYHETIDVMPWDDMNGFIKHIITRGYDPNSFAFDYRKYMGIFGAGRGNEDSLHVFLEETEKEKQKSCKSFFVLKAGDDDSKELRIQEGKLMHGLDPDMYEKIKALREKFSINGVSLLDNIFGVCYGLYSDEEIEALLGVKRSQMIFQDGSNNLADAYLGIGQASTFILTDKHVTSDKELIDLQHMALGIYWDRRLEEAITGQEPSHCTEPSPKAADEPEYKLTAKEQREVQTLKEEIRAILDREKESASAPKTKGKVINNQASPNQK